ncbi:MAG: polysaccharide biosynthesis protein [Ignavibacteria bacterium]|nr:MAG: polysaccharide biosynthesis protein [Ignavibacteria bacterium]KAF0161234.1 MAG: polysaccharide biosynthesis protein [Ignavibacteria bacterium]
MHDNNLKVSTKKNLFFSILAVSFRLIANVFVFWLLARVYDPHIFGQFTFAHSLATTLIVIADFGFDVFLTTEISSKRENIGGVFSNLLSYKILFTFFTMVGMLFFAVIMHSSDDVRILVFLFTFFLASTTLTNFIFALFRGVENLGYEMKVSFIMNGTLVVILPILLVFKAHIILVAIVFIAARILGLCLAVNYSSLLVGGLNFGAMFQGFGQLRNKMFVFGFHFVFSFVFFQLDTILLMLLKGEYDTGIYQAVFKFIMLPLAIPEIVMNVLLPVLTRLFGENKEEWKRISSLLSKSLLLIVLPVSLLLFSYADDIIVLVYGIKYVSAAPVLKIFSLIILVRFLLEPFALMLTTSGRQYVRLFTVVIATLINLILNIILIPKLGAEGAAIVSLITNLFVGVVFVAFNIDILKAWFANKQSLFLLLVVLVEIPLLIFAAISMKIAGLIIIAIFFGISVYVYLTEYERKFLFSEVKNIFKRIWTK